MKQGKLAIIKVLIVFICAFCIDGGRTLFLISSCHHIEFADVHPQDIETPHQHHFSSLTQDEQIPGLFKIDFSALKSSFVNFQCHEFFPSQEYLNSIWQPPRLS